MMVVGLLARDIPEVPSQLHRCVECGKGVWISEHLWATAPGLEPICPHCAIVDPGVVFAVHPASAIEASKYVDVSRMPTSSEALNYLRRRYGGG